MFLLGQMVSPSHSHAHEHVHAHDHAHHQDEERETPIDRCEVCIVAVKDDADLEINPTPELEPVDGDIVHPHLYCFGETAFKVTTSTHPPPKPNIRPDRARAPPSIF